MRSEHCLALPLNLKMRLLIVNMLRILRFRGSKREIWFRRILTPALSPEVRGQLLPHWEK